MPSVPRVTRRPLASQSWFAKRAGPRKRGGLAAARHDHAEILAGQTQVHFLFFSHGDEGTGQIFDLLTSLDELAGTDSSLVLGDNVTIGGRHFKWAVRVVHLNVLAEMAAEPVLLSRTGEVGQVFAETRKFKQFTLRSRDILCDDNIAEEDVADLVVVDAAGRAVLVAILACSGPEVSLWIEGVSILCHDSICRQESYVIDQRIGCDVVIAGQFCQGQTLTALGRGRA